MGFSFSNICRNVLPAGTYKAQVVDIKFKESGNGATSYNMEVHYVITEGAYAKRTFIDTIYEKAFSFRLKPFLNACAIDLGREFETAKELYDYGVRSAKGKVIMVELAIRTYNGNEYNDVKSWAPVASSTTTIDDVMAEFKTDPNVMPKAPKIDDLPTANSDEFAPIADIVDDDMPF